MHDRNRDVLHDVLYVQNIEYYVLYTSRAASNMSPLVTEMWHVVP